jgi:TolB-like protein
MVEVHMKELKKRSRLMEAIPILLIFLSAAYGYAQELGPEQEQQQGQVKEERIIALQKVAVLPFLNVRPEAPGQRMMKGLYGNYFFRTGDLPARAASEVTTIFQRRLNARGRCELIPLDQAQAATEGLDPKAFQKDPIAAAAQIGQELGVEAVVIGAVYHYEQRQGSALGVQSPASAAFDAHLIRVADKKVLWSGRFDETQHSLMENLLTVGSFVKGGAQWVTVEKWVELGIERMLRTFPTLNR